MKNATAVAHMEDAQSPQDRPEQTIPYGVQFASPNSPSASSSSSLDWLDRSPQNPDLSAASSEQNIQSGCLSAFSVLH